MRAMLQATFEKMNLVTREEFDIQTSVLTRTREKLEALEKTVARLEQQKNNTAAK
jgi:BMFP domain-containing protein YqiC